VARISSAVAMELPECVRLLVEGCGGRRRSTHSSVGTAARISVICPTSDDRVLLHEQLYRVFATQRWLLKELVVVDTGRCPSPVMERHAREDARVVYRHFGDASAGSWSVGLKRNVAVFLASGDIIAHFDDDDLYAPTYLTTMIGALGDADAVMLSRWYVFEITSGTCAVADPVSMDAAADLVATMEPGAAKEEEKWNEEEGAASTNAIYGQGFSYVYRRQACEDHHFPDVSLNEDGGFIEGLLLKGWNVRQHQDDEGIVLHIQHGANTSSTFCALEVPRSALNGAPIEHTPGFKWYLQACPRREPPHGHGNVSNSFAAAALPPRSSLEARMRGALLALGVPRLPEGCYVRRTAVASRNARPMAWPFGFAALACFRVRCLGGELRGTLFVEPGRMFGEFPPASGAAPPPRFAGILHGRPPATIASIPVAALRLMPDPERLALLHIARVLWGRLGVVAAPAAQLAKSTIADVSVAGSAADGVVQLHMREICGISALSAFGDFARLFPGVRVEADFGRLRGYYVGL